MTRVFNMKRIAFRHCVLMAASAVMGASLAQAAPRTYPPGKDTSALQVPCTKRYGKPVFAPKIPPSMDAGTLLSKVFVAQPTYGFPDNVTITPLGINGDGRLRIRYPKGSIAPSSTGQPIGGLGFYSAGNLPKNSQAVCLRYRLKFTSDFDFRKGGKLPGLYGGANPPSGGARPKGDDGFTVRLMWRKDGAGEIYLYAPNMKPDSANGGMQLGTGKFAFPRDAWTDIQLETVLNTPGHSDGVIRLWINETPAIFVKGVRFRQSAKLPISGLMFSTFFGGHDAGFEARKTEYAEFAVFRLFAEPVADGDKS